MVKYFQIDQDLNVSSVGVDDLSCCYVTYPHELKIEVINGLAVVMEWDRVEGVEQWSEVK
tara:strand:- start:86 stop:265 length:180 start_codon:yes stop_codon:yes gene_type:complete